MRSKKPTIVFIDSCECINKILDNKKIQEEFNILIARNGKEGVDMIFKNKPDLIFSDIAVPKGDIFYIIDVIKKDPETKDIPIVALTTLCSGEDKKKVEKMGVCDYILKHECFSGDLAKKIKNFLDKKEKNEK
jgi:CheY-like chemotaxis protein